MATPLREISPVRPKCPKFPHGQKTCMHDQKLSFVPKTARWICSFTTSLYYCTHYTCPWMECFRDWLESNHDFNSNKSSYSFNRKLWIPDKAARWSRCNWKERISRYMLVWSYCSDIRRFRKNTIIWLIGKRFTMKTTCTHYPMLYNVELWFLSLVSFCIGQIYHVHSWASFGVIRLCVQSM